MVAAVGRLDRRVTLWRTGPGRNDLNEPGGDGFIPLGPVGGLAAARSPVSDGERLRAQQVGADVTDRFEIRWAAAWADLNPKDQLRCEGRTYGIVGVKPIGRNRRLEITAVARADVGEA